MSRASIILGLILALTATSLADSRDSRTVSSGVLGEGRDWETPWYEIASGADGPTVLIVGGMHGNEPAGAAAAEQIRCWPIVRGRLLVIPRAAIPALRENQRKLPGDDEQLRDLNRNFPGEDESGAARGEIAETIWSFVESQHPDWVLDLHEGYEFNVSHKPPEGEKKSVGSSVIFFEANGHAPLVERMLNEVNATIEDPERKFVPLGGGPVDRSLVRACVRHLNAQGMILETTFKDQPLSTRSRQHRILVNEVLGQLGMIDRDCTDIFASPGEKGEIVIGVFDGNGTSSNGPRNLNPIFESDPTMTAHQIGPYDMTPEVLEQFDVVLFPGGSGSKQAAALGDAGRDAVREYVRDGGEYVGICAGAYLCSAHYSWSLDLIDTSVLTGTYDVPGEGTKQMWYRGSATTQDVQLTDAGREIFSAQPDQLRVRYQNGPIVSRANHPDLPPYEVLAHFRSEQVRHSPQEGTMVDTPAIVTAPFGAGNVLSISPHPEATEGLESMIITAIRWVVNQHEGELVTP